MEKSKVWIVWIFCLVLAALPAFWMPTPSVARDVGAEHGKGEFRPLHNLKKLQLTEAQKHDVAVILKENRDQFKGLRSQMAEARKNLFAAINAPEYNEVAVRQAAHEIARCQEELIVMRAQIRHQVRAVLTPEQLAKLDAMRERFRERIREHRHDRFERMDKWIDAHSG